jgi:tryptophanyl-tRNA synthetase
VLKDFGSRQFSVFKQALVDLAVARLAPLADQMKRLLADPAHVDAVLAKGSARAEAIAAPVYEEVKKILGFVRR